ncbi:glycoside hydrolase family 130 protein [Fibrella forsythiae]|uniref:Glycoside hydrolase family 130 protein n=1 Tax=Fibrella forsythiae TaxID=2817061 RepID=A0ABS3JRM5_9BACT|nr:glycoside hydrolase family 130 protein [Fibrella forsythiae]MBO0952645.1 glycoside hydrolase family 130 protein [Fibrella forsythiae]
MQKYTLQRYSDQPVLTTTDVKPYGDGFEVLGAFNPAACRFGDEILLLLRVAEAPSPAAGRLHVPIVETINGNSVLTVKSFPEPEGPYDPRVVSLDGQTYLTSLSHLRLARSHDGIHFTIDEKPFMFPARPDEAFGLEDARITRIDDTYWITYTAVSANGPGVGLAKTTDFVHVERVGMVLPPPNKDACLFPERVDGNLVMLHRPMVSDIGKPSVWICESPDGIHWGNHRYVFGAAGSAWDYLKIGAGPEPVRTDEGWLVLYHGASEQHEYALALALLSINDPGQLLDRSTAPLLTPELIWEREGFFPNVVFSNGWVSKGPNEWWVYYGAADSGVGLAILTRH